MTLVAVTTDVWQLQRELKMPGGVRLPAHMTVVRQNGELILFSPCRLNDDDARALAALGPVRHLVAPNAYHHLFLKAAADRYPDATVWMGPGVAKKHPEITRHEKLGDHFLPGVEILPILGAPMMEESVFFHTGSKTLLTVDLFFNIQKPANFASAFAFSLTGTRARFAFSRVWWLAVKNNRDFGQSLAKMMDWDFSQITVAHGDSLTSDAQAQAQKVLGKRLPKT